MQREKKENNKDNRYEIKAINKFLEELAEGKIKCQSNFCKKKIYKELYIGTVNQDTFLFCSKKCRKKQLEYSRMFLGEFVYSVWGDK